MTRSERQTSFSDSLTEEQRAGMDGAALDADDVEIIDEIDPDNPSLDAPRARELTRQIRVALEHSYTLIIAAYQGRAWAAMGYSSWDAYCQGEFGSLALQPPREERQAVVMSMREAGMSTRAIGSALQASHTTIERDIASSRRAIEVADNSAGGTYVPPAEANVVGLDGKSYPAAPARPRKPGRGTFEDVPLSDELLNMSPSEMGIAALSPSSFTSRPARERKDAARRLTGSMDSPLPLVIKLAGQITLDPTTLTVDEDSDAETLTELAADASRGVLALSHVLTAIDVKVLAGDVDDSVALTAVVTDAVDELGRFLDALHSRKRRP
jgi:enamine deaminase RidA (YjgF/YER057c/UK114 family)